MTTPALDHPAGSQSIISKLESNAEIVIIFCFIVVLMIVVYDHYIYSRPWAKDAEKRRRQPKKDPEQGPDQEWWDPIVWWDWDEKEKFHPD